MNRYEVICIVLSVADWELSGNMNVSVSSHVEISHFLTAAIIWNSGMDQLNLKMTSHLGLFAQLFLLPLLD